MPDDDFKDRLVGGPPGPADPHCVPA